MSCQYSAVVCVVRNGVGGSVGYVRQDNFLSVLLPHRMMDKLAAVGYQHTTYLPSGRFSGLSVRKGQLENSWH